MPEENHPYIVQCKIDVQNKKSGVFFTNDAYGEEDPVDPKLCEEVFLKKVRNQVRCEKSLLCK